MRLGKLFLDMVRLGGLPFLSRPLWKWNNSLLRQAKVKVIGGEQLPKDEAKIAAWVAENKRNVRGKLLHNKVANIAMVTCCHGNLLLW